jgi:16S rRNA (guanine527-N7)-methyltransferase
MHSEIIYKYFPDLSETQKKHFEQLYGLYEEWNAQINVVSRKDFDSLYERHVLHSLGIAKVCEFVVGTEILDVGTGGGFPGIPLAIMFPGTKFHLVDSIGKKIKVVEGVVKGLGLTNVTFQHERAEKVEGTYDFVVSRAVTRLNPFINWISDKFNRNHFNPLDNGVLYLKGGDLEEELAEVPRKKTLYNLSDYFEEEFFETKKVVHVPFGVLN